MSNYSDRQFWRELVDAIRRGEVTPEQLLIHYDCREKAPSPAGPNAVEAYLIDLMNVRIRRAMRRLPPLQGGMALKDKIAIAQLHAAKALMKPESAHGRLLRANFTAGMTYVLREARREIFETASEKDILNHAIGMNDVIADQVEDIGFASIDDAIRKMILIKRWIAQLDPFQGLGLSMLIDGRTHVEIAKATRRDVRTVQRWQEDFRKQLQRFGLELKK